MSATTREKDPRFVASGARGGRLRWDREAIARGETPGPRAIRLHDLTSEQRRLVLALIEAARAANAAVTGSPPAEHE